MNKNEALEKVQEIVRDILDSEKVVLSFETRTDTVEGWDSLNHVQIISEVQDYFGFKFSAQEMISWNNVGELCAAIVARGK